MIDYRLLLKRYMAKVIDDEGADYIDTFTHDAIPFTETEIAELKKISDECLAADLMVATSICPAINYNIRLLGDINTDFSKILSVKKCTLHIEPLEGDQS